jgi:hypothetical protein
LPAQQSQSTEKRSADLKALKIEALQHPVAYRLLSEL